MNGLDVLNLYRVVLVDDEIWALSGLRKIFQWRKYGFEVVGEYTSGEEALEAILNQPVDVVFTDIQMDAFSGIDLMKNISKRKKVKFVVVSAFPKFEYAQSAMQYGACEYCIKPVSASKAEEVLVKLKELLDEEHGVFKTVESLNRYDLKSADIENGKFLKMINYLLNNIDLKAKLGDVAKEFKLNASYCSTLFHKYYNCGFSEFMINIRMKNALKMLEESDLSIEEIAKKCGYDDYYYFHKVFKKIVGITPGQYRKSFKRE